MSVAASPSPALARAARIPRVSVGLPVYNGQDYLRECLESLLAQDYRDFELIISDNGSTDATEEICRKYAEQDARIRYLREPTNRGGSWNFSRLPQLARGEYFRWSCHDDTCDPAHLRTCVEALDRAAPSVILVLTGTAFIDEHGAVLRRVEEQLDTRGMPPHARYAHVSRRIRYSNALFGLFRREPLLATRLHAAYANSDYVLFGELALLGEFQELPGHLFHRRMHGQMSRKANTTQEQVAVWFDTSLAGRRFYFPELSMIRDQLGAVRRAPIGALEKLRALWVVPRIWMRRRWRYIARELLAPLVPRFRRYS
jgi:glycosyltransferase involved in cell wall biosynthesis